MMTKLQTRVTKEADEVAEHVESWIDSYIENLKNNEYNRKRRLINLLKTYKIKKSDSKYLSQWFTNLKNELEEAINHNDVDLVEGYNFLSSSKLKKLHEFVSEICDDFASYSKITKKKKIKKPEDIVKTLKYMDSSMFGTRLINSFDPVKILKCKSFIAYNTKTGDIYYYETDNSFGIKGTTLQNFNNKTSFVKRVSRNANKLIPKFYEIGPANIHKELLNCKTKSRDVTGRFNDTTILVRVLT
jgi:mRNA-degrading endonuclease RelE of RelBE toxin-antitoxin system